MCGVTNYFLDILRMSFYFLIGKVPLAKKNSILNTPSRGHKNMETFKVNSENKKWDANHHLWDGLD